MKRPQRSKNKNETECYIKKKNPIGIEKKKTKQLNYNTYGANWPLGGKSYKSQARNETSPM